MFNFNIGSYYNMQFYGPAILGIGLTRAKLVAIVDFGMASMVSNVATQHASVLAYLPPGSARDVSTLSFLVFETDTGARAAYAYAWVNESTIAVAQDKKVTAVIAGVGADDLARIKEVLVLAGYQNVSMSLT